jgi:hypothetical protein
VTRHRGSTAGGKLPCGMLRWMGRESFVGCAPQQRRRFLCGAEPNGCGGFLREVHTPYGTEPPVGAEPLCGLVVSD